VKRATLNSSTPTTFVLTPIFLCNGSEKTPQLVRLAEINALVTPLEKPSPRGDKAKNLFSLPAID
jgi:hypothetical protein